MVELDKQMAVMVVLVEVAALKAALHQLLEELLRQDKAVMVQEVTLLAMLAVLVVQVQLVVAQRLVVMAVMVLHLALQELR
jgi:hypothetical protein